MGGRMILVEKRQIQFFLCQLDIYYNHRMPRFFKMTSLLKEEEEATAV